MGGSGGPCRHPARFTVFAGTPERVAHACGRHVGWWINRARANDIRVVRMD